jgi:hypothetical protein
MAISCKLIAATLCSIFLCIGSVSAKEKKLPGKYSSKEIRNLVISSLDKSKVDLECMRDYVFSEIEVFTNNMDVINKKNKIKINKDYFPSFRKEYVWFLRGGFLVRSPTLVDGVAVIPSVKTAAEETWLKRAKKNSEWKSFLDYFFDFQSILADSIFRNPPVILKLNNFVFNFSEGVYSCIGEKVFEGRNVIEAKYVPSMGLNLFILLIPEEHQIVKIAIGGGAQGGSSITEMTMAKQDGTIWLPQKYTFMHFKNPKELLYYTREYHSFSKTNVNTNITFEGTADTEEKK